MKNKIAISLTPDVVKKIDSRIDGTTIRSRSQAIEVLVRRGLATADVSTAFLLLSKRHVPLACRPFKGSTLLEHQLAFFRQQGVSHAYILAQGPLASDAAAIVQTTEHHNGDALRSVERLVQDHFVVMSGDVYAQFDLRGMIAKHLHSGKIATIGLMSSPVPSTQGTAILDGDLVRAFAEKPRKPASHVVNAGIYIFSPQIFPLLHQSLERTVLPALARDGQLTGFFIRGEYQHFG